MYVLKASAPYCVNVSSLIVADRPLHYINIVQNFKHLPKNTTFSDPTCVIPPIGWTPPAALNGENLSVAQQPQPPGPWLVNNGTLSGSGRRLNAAGQLTRCRDTRIRFVHAITGQYTIQRRIQLGRSGNFSSSFGDLFSHRSLAKRAIRCTKTYLCTGSSPPPPEYALAIW